MTLAVECDVKQQINLLLAAWQEANKLIFLGVLTGFVDCFCQLSTAQKLIVVEGNLRKQLPSLSRACSLYTGSMPVEIKSYKYFKGLSLFCFSI